MGALLGVMIFMVMLVGGFLGVHFIDACIKEWERVFGK